MSSIFYRRWSTQLLIYQAISWCAIFSLNLLLKAIGIIGCTQFLLLLLPSSSFLHLTYNTLALFSCHAKRRQLFFASCCPRLHFTTLFDHFQTFFSDGEIDHLALLANRKSTSLVWFVNQDFKVWSIPNVTCWVQVLNPITLWSLLF